MTKTSNEEKPLSCLAVVVTIGLLISCGKIEANRGHYLLELLPVRSVDFWKKWQPRILVISSLLLQIFLVLLGKRRKQTRPRNWLRFFVWAAYLSADSVAILAIGVIFNRIDDAPNKTDLISFWAPFVIFHLGGPDTITAYAIEDNELWPRRLLVLVTQTALAIYIFLRAFQGISWLPIVTIIMLVAGIVKFGERIYSLRSASSANFLDSLLTKPEPGPDYAKFMEEFTLKKAEGFFVKADEVVEDPVTNSANESATLRVDNRASEVTEAYELFQTFKRLFVDLILSFQDRDESQSIFKNISDGVQAFKVVEIELGFAYDLMYTKAPIICTRLGCLVKLATFFATISVFITFIFNSRGNGFHKIDLIITHLLLAGIITLEIYAACIMLRSDWMVYWLKKHPGKIQKILLSRCQRKSRWSNSMAQYNLLDVYMGKKPLLTRFFLNFPIVGELIEEGSYVSYNEVTPYLKNLIFQRFKDTHNTTDLCRKRGSLILGSDDYRHLNLNWSTTEVDIDQSLLIWHIATDLCYYTDVDKDELNSRGASKHVSDYMLYLLQMCPFMLPIGIGMIRFRDTYAEAEAFFGKKAGKKALDKDSACKMLLRVNTEVLPVKVKGDRSKSVLFDAVRLATSLRKMELSRRWEVISFVWVEILAYAASHCRGNQHARQLRKGGELLTHVWLLMAHLGVTEQFQISQGHARAKLSAK